MMSSIHRDREMIFGKPYEDEGQGLVWGVHDIKNTKKQE